jgi:hypothetical protein
MPNTTATTNATPTAAPTATPTATGTTTGTATDAPADTGPTVAPRSDALTDIRARTAALVTSIVLPVDRGPRADARRRDHGQATTEYALVMLGAAAIALLVVTWATAGGGAGRIGTLFDRVLNAVTGRI